MPLTNAEAKNAQPKGKDYKPTDSGGLHLFVSAKGHGPWQLRYEFGEEKRLLLGTYPDGCWPAPATCATTRSGCFASSRSHAGGA